MKLSVVISAYNEEEKIEDCLKSVSFADEIILVDNSSSDKTAEIAKKFEAKIIPQRNNSQAIDLLKNSGFKVASGDWTLSIDADERVSPELREEIKSVLGRNVGINGYYLPRKNIIFNKWIKHTGWYPDFQLRLFKKGKGSFKAEHVHQTLSLDGKAGYLKNNLIHNNNDSIEQFVRKTVDLYAPSEAKKILKEGYTFSYIDAIRFPFNEFLRRFFAQEGFKDGFHGLMLSLLMAFYHFVIFAYIWQENKFTETENLDFLKSSKREFKKINKEIKYWLHESEIKTVKSLFKKTFIKIKQKLP